MKDTTVGVGETVGTEENQSPSSSSPSRTNTKTRIFFSPFTFLQQTSNACVSAEVSIRSDWSLRSLSRAAIDGAGFHALKDHLFPALLITKWQAQVKPTTSCALLLVIMERVSVWSRRMRCARMEALEQVGKQLAAHHHRYMHLLEKKSCWAV